MRERYPLCFPTESYPAKITTRLLGGMGSALKFGPYRDGEEDHCVLRVQAREKILLIYSPGPAGLARLPVHVPTAFSVSRLLHRIQGVEERGGAGI